MSVGLRTIGSDANSETSRPSATEKLRTDERAASGPTPAGLAARASCDRLATAAQQIQRILLEDNVLMLTNMKYKVGIVGKDEIRQVRLSNAEARNPNAERTPKPEQSTNRGRLSHRHW